MGELMFDEAFSNALLMLFCYAYIVLMIFTSGKLHEFFRISRKSSRKFLHTMIGNLPFIMPFFSRDIYPALVAAPFILVTLLASPVSPFKKVNLKLKGLADMTEDGHRLGLIFYAVSYTLLALFLGSKPYVVAVGILPMAYGDSAASIIGEKYGRRKYKLTANKSFTGSAAMFLASFFSVTAGLFFFSALYSFSIYDKLLPAIAAVVAATLVEGFSPMGFDNLTIPFFSVLVFLWFGGGV